MFASRLTLMPILCSAIVLSACSSLPVAVIRPATAPSPVEVAEDEVSSGDVHDLMATMRQDLTLNRHREKERLAADASRAQRRSSTSSQASTSPFEGGISTRRIVMGATRMPVRGVRSNDLVDTWGAPRDGGSRRHRGIDIFAPRGTEIYALADGVLTYIGEQPKGGRCLWLSTEDGLSFYYAHLDRWAAGLYEGMEVREGQLLGYVGNTGNARSTPSHLHLAVHEGGEAINPYMFLKFGRTTTSGGSLSGGVTASR